MNCSILVILLPKSNQPEILIPLTCMLNNTLLQLIVWLSSDGMKKIPSDHVTLTLKCPLIKEILKEDQNVVVKKPKNEYTGTLHYVNTKIRTENKEGGIFVTMA